MPQFELDTVGPARFSGLRRGRTPEEAVRGAGAVPDDARLVIGDAEDLEGWREVTVEGAAAGRVRLHQRMRFRRP